MAKRIFTIAIMCVIAVAFVVAWIYAASPFEQPASSAATNVAPARTVMLDGQIIRVSVADTEASREQGLGGRAGLAPDEGMLFIFPADGVYSFWMKDMSFSIDIVWIAANGSIVYMAQDVSPSTYPGVFTPTAMARYVLELPAGYVAAHNVKAGDIVRL